MISPSPRKNYQGANKENEKDTNTSQTGVKETHTNNFAPCVTLVVNAVVKTKRIKVNGMETKYINDMKNLTDHNESLGE